MLCAHNWFGPCDYMGHGPGARREYMGRYHPWTCVDMGTWKSMRRFLTNHADIFAME